MCPRRLSVVGCHVTISNMAPASRVRKEEGEGVTLLISINMNSDDDMCHHHLNDVPGRCHQLSSFIRWAGDVVLLDWGNWWLVVAVVTKQRWSR